MAIYTVRTESRYALINGVGTDVHEGLYMISLFQFLHRCYSVQEGVQFYSDRFMRYCKPNIILLRQRAQ
jgi:hypothetical protein